jgi:hypothetical protein
VSSTAPEEPSALAKWVEDWLRSTLGGQFVRSPPQSKSNHRRVSVQSHGSDLQMTHNGFEATMQELQLHMGSSEGIVSHKPFGAEERDEGGDDGQGTTTVLPPIRGAQRAAAVL